LKKLKQINLSCNRLQTLPETFGNLNQLETFELDEESEIHLRDEKAEQKAWFTHLPESFGNLSSLKHFCVYFSLLTGLPESFGSLKSLESLTIQRDTMVDFYFPSTMKNLKSLRSISINAFIQVPDFIGELKELTSLNISHNEIEVLPDFIGNLVKLKYLNLHSTRIKELPGWITNLKNLEYVDNSCTDIIINREELKKKLPKLIVC
jgi:Leucine-rich repeat (LRR) protein